MNPYINLITCPVCDGTCIVGKQCKHYLNQDADECLICNNPLCLPESCDFCDGTGQVSDDDPDYLDYMDDLKYDL